jgi:hypothetical protein
MRTGDGMDQDGSDWSSLLAQALDDEALCLATVRGGVPTGNDDLMRAYFDERGAVLTGATLGAAKRFVRDHAGEAPEEIRSLARRADEVDGKLPSPLPASLALAVPLCQRPLAGRLRGHGWARRVRHREHVRRLIHALVGIVRQSADGAPPEGSTLAVEFDEGVTARIDALAAAYQIDREAMMAPVVGSGITALERAHLGACSP